MPSGNPGEEWKAEYKGPKQVQVGEVKEPIEPVVAEMEDKENVGGREEVSSPWLC